MNNTSRLTLEKSARREEREAALIRYTILSAADQNLLPFRKYVASLNALAVASTPIAPEKVAYSQATAPSTSPEPAIINTASLEPAVVTMTSQEQMEAEALRRIMEIHNAPSA